MCFGKLGVQQTKIYSCFVMNTIARFFILSFCLCLVCVFSAPRFIFAFEQKEQIDSYLDQGDYEKAVVLLDAYFTELIGEKNTGQKQRPGSDFFTVGYLLADHQGAQARAFGDVVG